jgi:hypothetical protein
VAISAIKSKILSFCDAHQIFLKSFYKSEQGLFFYTPTSCISPIYFFSSPMRDSCLEPGKFEVLKMLDLQTKSAMKLV